MKNTITIGLITLSLLASANYAECDTAIKKLGRGVANIGTAPIEVVEQIKRVNDTDGPIAGVTYGVLKGVFMTGVRVLVGAYEVVTFPIPFPKNYGPILRDPEFFFEDMNW
ncbi:MAG: exosortase system-associated protein, TIGR04073 family [Candidatus Omnitrophota bacterium]